MEPTVLEVEKTNPAADRKGSADAWDDVRTLTFTPLDQNKETENTAFGGGSDFLSERAKKNAENPEVQQAYKEFLQQTKGLDPKVVEDCLKLAGDLGETGIKFPALGATSEAKQEAQEGEQGLVDPRVSGVFQTILRKFTNPLVIKDVINIGRDLAKIAMTPEGQQLISDIRSLVKHLKEA